VGLGGRCKPGMALITIGGAVPQWGRVADRSSCRTLLHYIKILQYLYVTMFFAVLRIRIQIWIRIHGFWAFWIQIHGIFGLLDLNPLVRGMDPNTTITKRK
jgi:hypothetical protein